MRSMPTRHDNAGGTITGDVLLGSADDSFIGIGGTVTGNIKGGAGDDWLGGGKVRPATLRWRRRRHV